MENRSFERILFFECPCFAHDLCLFWIPHALIYTSSILMLSCNCLSTPFDVDGLYSPKVCLMPVASCVMNERFFHISFLCLVYEFEILYGDIFNTNMPRGLLCYLVFITQIDDTYSYEFIDRQDDDSDYRRNLAHCYRF
jgi:hypothetical protein